MTAIYILIGLALLCATLLGIVEFLTTTYHVSILKRKYRDPNSERSTIATATSMIKVIDLYDQQALIKEEIEQIIKEMIS